MAASPGVLHVVEGLLLRGLRAGGSGVLLAQGRFIVLYGVQVVRSLVPSHRASLIDPPITVVVMLIWSSPLFFLNFTLYHAARL